MKWIALLLTLSLPVGCDRSGDGSDGTIDLAEPTPPTFLGPSTSQATPPPPISGGTLAMLATGIAIAADPDRDRIYIVDIPGRTKIADLVLSPGDEPSRVIEDTHHRVHVVLRAAGAIVTLTPDPWKVSARRDVCPAPRGIAASPTGDEIYVACAGGELVTLPGAAGGPTRTLHLSRDLRDVVTLGDRLYVSRLRSAEMLTIDATGNVVARVTPPSSQDGRHPAFAAWRLVAAPRSGRLFMLHQRGSDDAIPIERPGGYGGSSICDSIVQTTISEMTPDAPSLARPLLANTSVTVDLAFAHHSDGLAAISAGNAYSPGIPTLQRASLDDFPPNDLCSVAPSTGSEPQPGYEPIAVAMTPTDKVVVQSREPALLVLADTGEVIHLSPVSKADAGHALFHLNTGVGLACASCHLEGGEDGRAWTFEGIGARRTQSLRGGVLGTEPFHWDGDQHDFPSLVTEVFGHRMSGPSLSPDQVLAMKAWVDAIPLVRSAPPIDPDAVARGKALFHDVEHVGCIGCHGGARGTSNATVDVGTGGRFQVPSLRGLAWRSPFMHDGRAATLTDRFSPESGGDEHGQTSQLSLADRADLVAYLETL